MDRTSAGHPIRDALAVLASSEHTEEELRKLRELLGRLGGRSASATPATEDEAYEEEGTAAANEGSDVSVAPAPVSSVATLRFLLGRSKGKWTSHRYGGFMYRSPPSSQQQLR